MSRRWRPPRWAKPMKREDGKDAACEAIIRRLMGKSILEEEKKKKKRKPKI